MSGNVYQNIHIEGSGRVLLGNEYSSRPKDQRILKWLSPLDAWAKHNEARGQYREGTLDWFFENGTFLRWLDGDIQVLWCPGPMGRGKTILMSAVLDHIHERNFEQQDLAVAFVYCQHQARDVQTLTSILGCLLSQLYGRGSEKPIIPTSVSNAYSSRPNVSPTSAQLRQWLAQEAKSRRRTIILLDGLDEINQQLRDELLEALGFSHLSELQVFVTSRPLPDIKAALCDPTVLEVRAPTSSVEALISSRLKAPSGRRFVSLIQDHATRSGRMTTLEREVRTKVAGKAQGMLLLASLQLDLLLNSRNVAEIRKTLENLPPTLDIYYDMTWERISNYEDLRDSDYAKLALMWVVHAAQALSPRQLQHAVAASLADGCNIEDGIISQEDILSLCTGLLTSSAATLGNIAFSHFSAVEYFNSRCARYFPDAHDAITQACVRYLEIWLEGPSDTRALSKTRDILADDTALAMRLGLSNPSKSPSTHDPGSSDFSRVIEENEGEALLKIRSTNARQLFIIDRSGLGKGRQLVLLDYAYENLWYHTLRSAFAQTNTLELLSRHPVLYTVSSRGHWSECPHLDWMDKYSDFWYATLGIHHGLTNHAKFFTTAPQDRTIEFSLDFESAGLKDDNNWKLQAQLSSSEARKTRYIAMAAAELGNERVSRRRIYLIFASQLYFKTKCEDYELRKASLLENVRMAILGTKVERSDVSDPGDNFDPEDPLDLRRHLRGESTRTTPMRVSAADVTARYGLSKTSLICVVQAGELNVAETLLYKGIDTEATTVSGARALWYAYIGRNFDCMATLLEHGADISALSDDPVLSLPEVTIEAIGNGDHSLHTLKFLAYGPHKDWFSGLSCVVGEPECIEGVWQARIVLEFDRPKSPRKKRLTRLLMSVKQLEPSFMLAQSIQEYLREISDLWASEVDSEDFELQKIFESLHILLELLRDEVDEVIDHLDPEELHEVGMRLKHLVELAKVRSSQKDDLIELLEYCAHEFDLKRDRYRFGSRFAGKGDYTSLTKA